MNQDRLSGLPSPGERNMAVRVTPDAQRWLRASTPWIYDGSIETISFEGQSGDLAVIFDRNRKFLAIGLYDPASPIRIKVLHCGEPIQIDTRFWRTRLSSAFERRAALISDASTTGYRLVHGENDNLPGLVIDRYGDTLVVKLYTAAWFAHLRGVLTVAIEMSGAERVVLRLARTIVGGQTYGLADGDVIYGPPLDGPVEFFERGLRLQADVAAGQKTGFFLDQRDNRQLVRGIAENKTVLDVFASTGAFSVAAVDGGATSVHLIDQSALALATARKNLTANRSRHTKIDIATTVGDAFEELERLAAAGRRFDLVIVDPPSFAQRQASVDGAIRAYQRLTHLALGVLAPGGTLVQCSCSSRVSADEFFAAINRAAQVAHRPLMEKRRTFHAVDHPIGFEHGAYLKTIFTTG